jgi:hypothetical protein
MSIPLSYLLLLASVAVPAFSQEPKEDIKKAGKATAEAGKQTGRAAKHTARKVKRGTKKAVHRGASKVEEKTR